MTDTAVQQQTDPNGQPLVTQPEREALLKKLATKFPLDVSNRIEMLAYTKSNGIKPTYFKYAASYYQQAQNVGQNRTQQQRQQLQQQQPSLQQTLNNNVDYLNQQLNLPQQPSVPLMPQSQHTLNTMLSQQVSFNPIQASLQSRMTNLPASAINAQPSILNQVVRLREPQKFAPTSLNTVSFTSTSTPSSISSASVIQTTDLPQSFSTQPQVNNTNLNDYLSQSSTIQNRYLINQSLNSRPRTTINTNANFVQPSISSNSNDILHQFVIGNPRTNSLGPSLSLSATAAPTLVVPAPAPPTAATSPSTIGTSTMITPVANVSSTGDRLLQQILLSNNDSLSNKRLMHNRQTSLQKSAPSISSQSIRSVNPMNTNITDNNNSLHSSLTSQQSSTVQSSTLLPVKTQISNVQVQPSSNLAAQQSPVNNNNNSVPFTVISQNAPSSLVNMNNSTPLTNAYSSPNNRSLTTSGSGSISSPDEETMNLIKYLKDNLAKLQGICQRYTNEGQLEKSRNAQVVYQQMVQFINNPTPDGLQSAKHIRDNLERASSRSQQSNSSLPNVSTTTTTNVTGPQAINLNQVDKGINEYISRDQKTRILLSKIFIEPLLDVINGVPHKKIRYDNDNNSDKIHTAEASISSNQSSLFSRLYDEIVSLPANLFLITPMSHTLPVKEFNDECINKNGLVLQCKLLEPSNPLVPPLRIRISKRYPQEQPEILSLKQTMPPKLDFIDDHPFFEQISRLFVYYLFKLPTQYTITDILNIWRQSVQAAI